MPSALLLLGGLSESLRKVTTLEAKIFSSRESVDQVCRGGAKLPIPSVATANPSYQNIYMHAICSSTPRWTLRKSKKVDNTGSENYLSSGISGPSMSRWSQASGSIGGDCKYFLG